MASLNHPNIAALRTAFTADNQLYMVMEYVEGVTMADLVEKGPIPVNEAVNYISQVLSAVGYAHQQHIIHRDIKPANMMLTPQGVIKLMDFGIARAGEERSLTMTGTTMGSLSYMSPEQVKGEATDGRSDLYSVGVSLYEFVTGQRPFTASSDYSIMAAHVKEAPKPPIELHPGLPATLNEIILMAIAKDPAQRFQTAEAFRNALSSVPVTAVSTATLEAITVDSMQTLSNQPTPPAVAPVRPVSAPVAAFKTPTPPPMNPTPTPMPPPSAGSGHRGLYMTLGALIVLAVLVVAGIYVPRISKTNAKAPDSSSMPQTADTSAPNTAQPSEPAPSTAPPDAASSAMGAMSSDSTPPSSAPAASAPADNSSATQAPPTPVPPSAMQSDMGAATKPSSRARARKLTAQNNLPSGMASDAAAAAQGDNGMSAGNNAAEMDELEKDVDQLSNRAASVNSGLDRLQQQQAASGYGLRGDMVERQASMKSNLYKAEEAMQHHDVARAKKYVDMTGKDLEALEKFLGH